MYDLSAIAIRPERLGNLGGVDFADPYARFTSPTSLTRLSVQPSFGGLAL